MQSRVLTDQEKIEVADRLVREDWISQEVRDRLIVKDGQIWDDTEFPVDICENGDVFIHDGGAYPIILHEYFVL